MNLQIDGELLVSEIETLATFSEAEAPVVTRIVFTPADLRARAWLKARCDEAGLTVRSDSIGNTFARWNGSDESAPAVGTGSHIDAIPNAGKYDGVVGVLGGLEAIRALQRGGFRPRSSIELLVFTAEEPTRFGIGCLGSRLLSGTLSPDAAQTLIDRDGASVEDVRAAAGFKGKLKEVKLPNGYYKAFVELHIEQGPLLEREGIPLGIVTKIAAPASLRISIEGAGGHAGGVLMPDRRDALCAAAELILAIENAALSRHALDLACKTISAKRRVSIETEVLNADAPGDCALFVIDALSRSCTKYGLKFTPMVSRAYHDSLFMARIAPAAMLFIPCRNGYSHRPDEYASPEDIAKGTLVLAETLAMLSA
jgi:ureidoglycolate amidohydrolase